MGKKDPKKDQPRDTGNEFHIHRFYSTKPGHAVLRSERCNCPIGSDHGSYESP